jgi:hypothetical protein
MSIARACGAEFWAERAARVTGAWPQQGRDLVEDTAVAVSTV